MGGYGLPGTHLFSKTNSTCSSCLTPTWRGSKGLPKAFQVLLEFQDLPPTPIPTQLQGLEGRPLSWLLMGPGRGGGITTRAPSIQGAVGRYVLDTED